MYKHILAVVLVIITLPISSWSQDAVYSQFFSSPILLNPALTGTTYAPRFVLNYRNQWPSHDNAYVTYSASYDQYFSEYNSGIGLSINTDVAGNGIYNTNQVMASYSYNFKFTNNLYLKGGMEAGVVNTNVDWNQLVFFDQLSPLTGGVDPLGNPNPTQEVTPFSTNRNYFDVGAGLIVYTQKFYGGASVKHINTPNESITGEDASLPLRVSVHAGGEIELKRTTRRFIEGAYISPNILYIQQNEFRQLNVGAYASSNTFFGGLWYRYVGSNSDAVIALIGYQFNIFKLGYSYDVTVSGLGNQSGGAHEISFAVNFDKDPRIARRYRARRYMDCFQMFR